MCSVSIIIVNYHTESLIIDCLASIFDKTTGVDFEIIIVDNDPSGGLGDTLRQKFQDCPDNVIRYLPSDRNDGFGAANNDGFRIASGKYLFCLNPDTLLVNNAIAILRDYMEMCPDCGACGGNLLHADMRHAPSMRRILPGLFWEISEMFNLNPERVRFGRSIRFNHTGKPFDVGYICGADLMIRKEIVDSIGGFCEEFFMFFEETDLCARIRKAGFRVVSVPSAKIIHLEGQSFGTGTINENKIRYYEESRKIYYRRNVSDRIFALANRIYKHNLRRQSKKDGIRGEIAKLRLRLVDDLFPS